VDGGWTREPPWAGVPLFRAGLAAGAPRTKKTGAPASPPPAATWTEGVSPKGQGSGLLSSRSQLVAASFGVIIMQHGQFPLFKRSCQGQCHKLWKNPRAIHCSGPVGRPSPCGLALRPLLSYRFVRASRGYQIVAEEPDRQTGRSGSVRIERIYHATNNYPN